MCWRTSPHKAGEQSCEKSTTWSKSTCPAALNAVGKSAPDGESAPQSLAGKDRANAGSTPRSHPAPARRLRSPLAAMACTAPGSS